MEVIMKNQNFIIHIDIIIFIKLKVSRSKETSLGSHA